MHKRSDLMLKGAERAPHRSLLRAGGFTERELQKPMIGIADSQKPMADNILNNFTDGNGHIQAIVFPAKLA